RRLFVLALDTGAVTAVPDSDGARDPFFSPDGAWLGFWAAGKLRKTSVASPSAVPICDSPETIGASWGFAGVIVYASIDGKLYQLPDGGGTPRLVAASDSLVSESYRLPEILPSNDVVLATRVRNSLATTDMVAIPLRGGPPKTVLPGVGFARY